MRLFNPDPSFRWLFCLTHPDDEISICAWIRRCVQSGCPVYMSWTHSNPMREREARAAAHLLGVPPDHLFFFGATDGSVCDEMPNLLSGFREMMAVAQPNRVCCGAFEQGHIDHDATNFLVRQTAPCPVLEVPFYHTYLTRFQTLNRFSDSRGQEILDLELDEQHLKRTIARQYPSQNIWSVLLWYELSQQARFRPMLLARTERMRLQTRSEFRKPAHPPKLAAKIEESKTWKRWVRAVDEFCKRV